MAKLIGCSQVTINTMQDAYNISLSVKDYIFTSTSNGIISESISIHSTISVTQGGKNIAFSIGTISKPNGFSAISVDNLNKTITFSVAANTSTLADSGIIILPIIIDGITYNQSFTWSKIKKGDQGNAGLDAYSVNASRLSYIISTDKDGKIHTAAITSTIISVFKGTVPVSPIIGTLPNITGCSLSKSGATVTITFNIGNSLAENGTIDIPFTADGRNFSISFAYAKARTGANGATGAAGVDANMLDWVKDWNTNKTMIGSDSIITPKIFAGVKNTNGTITGIAIGKFALSTYNASGSITTETINGIYGFKDGYRTFYVDSSGNAQLGRDNQSIKYNSTSGKIEFGSEVSLNWVNAINTAKNEAISTASGDATTKANNAKNQAITSASGDATSKANQAKNDAISSASTDATNKVNAIQVGIRNYIRNSTFNTATLSGLLTVEGVTAEIDTTTKYQGYNTIRIVQTAATNSEATANRAYFKAIKICSPASFCMWVKSSANTNLRIRLGGNGATDIPITTTWKLIKLENKIPNSDVVLFGATTAGVTYYIALPMLVEGTKAVDWSPAFEDIEFHILEAKNAGINARNVADAITKKSNDEKWATKLTYIDQNGIFTGTLSANTVNAIKINASQIVAGTIDAARINVESLKSSLITAANINALTLSVVKGSIGGWNIDADSIFRGTKNNTSGAYTAASGAITFGSSGIRGFKWRLDSNGTGSLAGGNISWDATGNVTFGPSVSLSWTNAANDALNSAKSYADTKKTEAISAASTDAQTKANQAKSDAINSAATDATNKANNAKTDAINAASTDATNKVNNIKIGGRNLIGNTNQGALGWSYTCQNGTFSNSEVQELGVRANKFTTSVISTGYHVITRTINRLLIRNNTEYTISFEIRSDFDTTMGISIRNGNGQNVLINWANVSIKKGIWTKIQLSAVSGNDTTTSQVLYFTGFNALGSVIFANLKLEEGNKATQWTPANEDIDYKIAEAKTAGTNAQAVADSITKKANDEKWATKLTYIDQSGIFTGTLSANTVNAVKINASQITTGIIDASRINVEALKSSLITAGNIDALTLNVTKGKIGGWSIGADSINNGTLNQVGQTPIQIRTNTAGTTGSVYAGSIKPYGITMTWYQSSNAGHFIMGQVMANGTTIKTGFVGIQMMAWDSTEYFCLSANSTKSGAKEVYNRIAGWAFDNTRIWKNNVSLGADGSIYNGNLWKLNNDGSGRLANGNISWDTAGNVTFGSSVSLNWSNAANNALTSAKTYADTKKTEAINTAATDATSKANNAKNDAISSAATDATNKVNNAKNELNQSIENVRVEGLLYCKGTGLNRNANRMLILSGKTIYNTSGRGLQLTIIKRSDLSVVSNSLYDVYGDINKRIELSNKLNDENDSVIVVLTSFDAVVIDDTLGKALARCGGTGNMLTSRNPYALVGIPGIGKGCGLEIYSGTETNAPFAEITTKITNGTPVGLNSTQGLALGNAAAAQSVADAITKKSNDEKWGTKLTYIDANGIFTGTLSANTVNAVKINASQITAGTISADRIAAGSINSSKLDANSIRSSIINTDYIDGLTLNFVRGKIGGWTIGSDNITIGSIGAAGTMPIQLRSTATGTGYVYNGQYKPYGLTMTWHQSNNAGHIVFGQVLATGNTVKTGFMGIQMMNWLGAEYFCLSTNYSKSGAVEVYNRIAGWGFDNTRIWKNNVSLSADGSITNGNLWQINNNGSGRLANGNIAWDAAGNVTFGSSVSLNWNNAANNALNTAKSYADTKKTEAINTAASDATNKANATKELAQAMAFGRMIYRDPTFFNGNNGAGVYNNSNNGTVSITRTTDNNAPNDSKQVLVIKNIGTSSPNLGGFYFGTPAAYRKIFITRIIAKIPTGRSISYHSNSIGTGGTQKWLTDIAGTGSWSEYICKVSCGTASFSNTHFFSITGAVGTTTAPVEWRLAYATVFDITSTEKYTTTIDSNGIYTGTIRANQVLVDSALVVGGSTYNGSVSVRDASNNVKVTLDRNGIKAVGGVIGGWTIASTQISKGSVVLSADGSIVNGTKWRLNLDGSGQVANGNISWTTAGAVTIAGTIKANKSIISNSQLNNVTIDGSIRNAFQNGYFVLNNGTGGFTVSTPGVQNNNNVVIPAVGGGWNTAITIPWTADYNGFRCVLLNSDFGGQKATGILSLPTPPNGKYYWEHGKPVTKLDLYPGEGVEMIGFGEGSTFKGWIILQRVHNGTSGSLGFPLPVMYSGCVTSSGYLRKFKSFDGDTITVSKLGTGHYRCKFSVSFSTTDNYMVMLSGEGFSNQGIYASIRVRTTSYFEVYTGDDATANDGGFNFLVINTHRW